MDEEYELGENVTDLAKGKDGGGVEVSIKMTIETIRRLDFLCRLFNLSFSQAIEEALSNYNPRQSNTSYTEATPAIVAYRPRSV